MPPAPIVDNIRDIICASCGKPYPSARIDVELNGERVKSLAEHDGSGGRVVARRTRTDVFLGRRPKPAKEDEPDTSWSAPYVFKCPEGHVVDGNSGTQFPIAVVGESGASKSHFLAAIVRDLEVMMTLGPVGVKLDDGLYEHSKISDDETDVYRNKVVLPSTEATLGVLGPYSHRLRVNGTEHGADEYSMLLFDVAGETLASAMNVAMYAKFVYLSRGVIVLIDPNGFLPSSFDDQADETQPSRVDAASDVRRGIRAIINTLAKTKRTQADQLRVPFCFVVAKADAVEWPSDFEWDTQTRNVLAAGSDNLREALQNSSVATRSALGDLGGHLVIDEIEGLLAPGWVRYTAASASSCMASAGGTGTQQQWAADPQPEGVALTVLHLLDLAGALPASRA